MVAIMKSLCFSLIILASFATLFSVADARRFNVGGNGVWDVNPQENYNTWAERNRFQVNDTLYFKYVKGSDSVLQVTESDYESCNIENPIKKFDNGESVVTFDRSGPFYYISGDEDRCKKGQKLIVVVLAVRSHSTVPISPPSKTQPPKSPSPVSPIAPANPPSKSQPPKASSSPVSHSPADSPSQAPAKSPTVPSPSQKSLSPASSPSPSSPSPDQTPRTTPAADTITAPAPSPKNSASGVDVTSVITTVLSVSFNVLMFA